MSYLDESGLSTYNSSLKEWISSQESKTITSSIYPWTKTTKAGAVSCYPVGGTELKPVVDFLFTEVPPASGDKGPDNPSTISGVSSIECNYGGKNLLYYPLDTLTKTIDGVTFTYNSDGSFSVSGTSTRSPVIYRIAYSTGNQSVYSYLPAGTYTLSGCPQDGNWNTYSLVMMDTDGILKDNLGNTVTEYGSGRTFTIDEPKRIFCMMRLGYAVGTDISGIVYKPQLEIGSSVTTLEPANRSKLPLSLGSTYYGGTLDAASGVMTVTHEVLSFDGTEELWVFGGEVNSSGIFRYCYYPLSRNAPSDIAVEASSHFDYLYNWNSESEHFYVAGNGCNCFSTKTTLEAFKSWLASQKAAGTPVTITYPLATPTTVQLDPVSIFALAQADKYTPRLNTIYTDASAVQVGYVKSPIREEYELQQAVIAQGGNI